MFIKASALVLLLTSTLTQAAVRKYNLDIVNGNVNLDGTTRGAVLVNGQFPGTVITGEINDDFELTVNNKLTDETMDLPTAIHWHGFFQARTAHEDGPSHVNQAPILPGDSYTYRFKARDQAGTFWYHSHFHAQYVDGCRSGIIIRDPNDEHKGLYDYDLDEHLLQFSDWYPQKSRVSMAALTASGSEPTPSVILINGLGGKQGSYVVNVEKNKRYRLRLLNSGAMVPYEIAFDGHEFDVIEVDSVNHVPVRASKLTIYPGQRYSVVLKADKPVGNYAITIKQLDGPDAPVTTTGILRYAGAPAVAPRGLVFPQRRASAPALKDDMLHPTRPDPILSNPKIKADITIPIKFSKTTIGGKSVWQINNSPFEAPHDNVLDAVLRHGATTQADFAKSSNIFVLDKPNAVVDLVFSGAANGFNHPFHLHGHAFSVLTAGANPVMRDVQAIGGSSQTLRFVADNPGVWFMHCHIDWHLEQGLAVIFVERPNDIRSGPQSVAPSQEWLDKHAKWEAWRDAHGEH
ncbi:laccase [Fimicolochytrium jonesii]|uniref:laccase n=1 Tax=Fimicolochytrium jonesii TaxID=1396493 RepID=UPI0022FDE0A6|nr:laccase [Fimicolochytrium jonesii]KAI8819717.1 laccase [Fimicolochytrium jonesii]